MTQKSKKSCKLTTAKAARGNLAAARAHKAFQDCASGKKSCSAAEEKKLMGQINKLHASSKKDTDKLWFVCSKSEYDKAMSASQKPAVAFWKNLKK
jgi:hypothetical protein